MPLSVQEVRVAEYCSQLQCSAIMHCLSIADCAGRIHALDTRLDRCPPSHHLGLPTATVVHATAEVQYVPGVQTTSISLPFSPRLKSRDPSVATDCLRTLAVLK